MPAATNGVADQLDPGAINRRLAELERQVKELRAARRLESATIGAGGLNVSADGGINVVDKYGNYLLTLGALTPNLSGTGDPQYGLLVYRQTDSPTPGTLALSMFNGVGALPQTFGLWDNSGNTIVTDDGASAQGLARPYLSFPVAPANQALWNGTTAGSWANLFYAGAPKQHPKVVFQGAASVPSGVTGQLRLWDSNVGAQVGSTVTLSSAPTGVAYTIGPAALAGNYLSAMGLVLQGQITAGAGTLAAMVYAAYGCQS